MNALTPINWNRPRLVLWFSCGTASAVNTKLALARYSETHDIAVCRCIVVEEHADNDRFAAECETWFGVPIINLRSTEYLSCQEVWERRRYMSGIHGAPCTIEMKKAVRWAFETEWQPDLQSFGYTADEQGRVDDFRTNNPDVRIVTLLIDDGLSKEDCHAIVDRAGILRPITYRLGFHNANCLGCVKAQGPAYWNRTRRHFPEVFAARALLSRALGVRLVKLSTGDRERIFLDELDLAMGEHDDDEPMPECGLLCYIAESKMKEKV